MNIITRESVFSACSAIVERGDKPSIRKVLDEIGGGSPNSVNPFLNEWKAENPDVDSPLNEISRGFKDALKREILLRSKLLVERLEQQNNELSAALNASRTEYEQAKNAVEKLRDALEAANKREIESNITNAVLNEKIASLNQQLETLQNTHAQTIKALSAKALSAQAQAKTEKLLGKSKPKSTN